MDTCTLSSPQVIGIAGFWLISVVLAFIAGMSLRHEDDEKGK
jgi:hypothetical protein